MLLALQGARDSLRASPIFAFYLAATLLVAGVLGLMTFQPDLFPGLQGMNHFGDLAHRTHDLTYGFLFTTIVIGVLAQVRRPTDNVAAMVAALIPGAGLLLASVLSGYDKALSRTPLRWGAIVAVVAALLHPSGRAFFRSFRVARLNPVMLGLVGVAAVPLLGFASTNLDRQRNVLDAHSFPGHYAFMATLCFTIIGVGVLASFRPDGWQLTASIAGGLSALLGITSLIYPDVASSLDTPWALAAITWGVVFVAVARATSQAERPAPAGSRALASKA